MFSRASIHILNRAIQLLLAFVLGWCVPVAQAQTNAGSAFDFVQSTQPAPDRVKTESAYVRLTAWAPDGIAKGKPLWLGLHIQHQPQWHTYWKNPGQAGAATTLQWQLPEGWQRQDIIWATPQTITVGELVNYGYSHDVLLAAPVQVQADMPADAPLDITLQAQWLACKTACVPQQAQLQLTLPNNQAIQADAELFKQLQASTPKDLPHAQADVKVHNQQATITVGNLPQAWHGKTLNFYPETPQIFSANAAALQTWQDDTWKLSLPLDALRQTAPTTIPLVLAVRADAALNTAHIISNAPSQPSYRMVATAQGDWQPVKPVERSSQLQAALQENINSHNAAAPTSNTAPVSMGFSMLLAFVGGLILNLMPCVFPVLAIKVLSFVRHSTSPRELRLSAYAYAVGVVLSLLVLAGILLALRAGGAALGWGFQLQNPYIVSALGLLFAVLGFNFLGWFEIPSIPLPARFGQQRSPVIEAFLSGILTVLVATPCSAPFVGTALAAALVLPTTHALLLFVCMGLGLSLPVLLASFYPKLISFLPKPGAWMELLRQVMAFFMFGTVIWLVWVLGKQSGIDATALFMLLVLLLAGVFWAWRIQGRARKWLVAVFSVLLLFSLSIGVVHLQSNPRAAAYTSGSWKPWSPQAVQQALQNKRTVFVDFTAAWCITCQLNKQTVLERAPFQQWAQTNQIVLLRADWTNQDPAITASLQSLGRVSVPTYAVYHPDTPNQPKILGEIISLEAIKKTLP